MYRELARHDFRRMLATYPGPVLLLNGEHDRLNRRAERRMRRAVAHATVRVVPEAGHGCNLERPEFFSQAVREFACTYARRTDMA